MLIPRAGVFALFVSFSIFCAGCHSTSTVGAVFPRNGTAVASEKTPPKTDVVLSPGMEVQWQVLSVQNEPGQVSSGKGMIGPDGTVVVGPYGSCPVAGLTLNQAAGVLENHLIEFIKSPKVRVTLPTPIAQLAVEPLELAWRPARNEGTSAVAPAASVVAAERSMKDGDSGIQTVAFHPNSDNEVEHAGPIAAPTDGPEVVEAGFARRTIYRPGFAHAPVVQLPHGPGFVASAPGELSRVLLPPYVIGPPDILQIESLKGLLNQPVRGPHLVRPDGTVSLGSYGSALVAGRPSIKPRMRLRP